MRKDGGNLWSIGVAKGAVAVLSAVAALLLPLPQEAPVLPTSL